MWNPTELLRPTGWVLEDELVKIGGIAGQFPSLLYIF
jgi:hypothetical protein